MISQENKIIAKHRKSGKETQMKVMYIVPFKRLILVTF